MKLKPYANIVEGPQGFRMPEALAREIEAAAKGLPADFTFRRMAKSAAEFQLEEGSRTDVSTITTDAVDHQKEVVLPSGLDFAVFRANPVVPFSHNYDTLPVGKCTWIKGSGNGIAAMTKYAKCPPNHTDWLPDAILSMMQEGMCTGKSIGFIPQHMRAPTAEEVARRPELKAANVVIDKARLLEYSIAPVPCNPDALTVAVSKSLGGDSALAALVIAAAKAMAPVADPDAMPACPKCKSNAAVTKADDASVFTCAACDTSFDEDGDPIQSAPTEVKAIEPAPVPEIVVPFVSAATYAAYRKRLADRMPAMIEAQARAKFADAIDRLRGRA